MEQERHYRRADGHIKIPTVRQQLAHEERRLRMNIINFEKQTGSDVSSTPFWEDIVGTLDKTSSRGERLGVIGVANIFIEGTLREAITNERKYP